jgi:SPP1 gp7 family putative phage head morphogenesis protein
MPDLNSDLDDALEPIIRFLQSALRTTIEGHLVRAYIQGDKELIYWGITKGGIPIAYEGPPSKQAIKWARDYCAKMVTKMDDETKTRLAKAVAEAIENKRGVPGLAKNIREEFADMTRYRSQMIARTETAKALSEGSQQRMKDMGIEYKEWVRTSGYDCDVCEDNENAGIIPIDDAFPSGDMTPPSHPNCMCVVSPARK